MTATWVTVVKAGPLTLVQDLGRPGLSALGVAPSGAADREALIRANLLLGNETGAAALEVTFGGVEISPSAATSVALAGARDRTVAPGVVVVPAGERLRLGVPVEGLRSYLAFPGGIDAPAVLGSRATCTLTGIGPPPVRSGTALPLGPARRPVPAAVDPDPVPLPGRDLTVRYWPGPDLQRLPGPVARRLADAPLTVGVDSNRVAVHLTGWRLDAPPAERDPIGLLPGAVQLIPDGSLRVFLADHPLTGGYPLIGVVDPTDVRLLAQARPGTTVRFVPTSAG